VPRPRGVTYLGVWYVIVGITLVAVTAYAIYVAHTIPLIFEAFQYDPTPLLLIAVGVAGAHFVAAFGLWTLRWWARWMVLGFSAFEIALGMFSLPFGFVAVLLNLVTVWYVSERRVREAFTPKRAPGSR